MHGCVRASVSLICLVCCFAYFACLFGDLFVCWVGSVFVCLGGGVGDLGLIEMRRLKTLMRQLCNGGPPGRRPLNKILVANRGEVAVRIIR